MTDTRKAIDRAIGEIVRNASNFPEKVQARILGQDTGPLRKRLTDAMLAARSTPPADDVREALADAVKNANDGACTFEGELDPGVDAAIVAALTRNPRFEVRPRGTGSEPTAEDVEQMRAPLNAADIDYSTREQRADAGGGDMEPGDWFAFLARAALRADAEAPRGTVTDAEVNAAVETFWKADDPTGGPVSMRAALEAAR